MGSYGRRLIFLPTISQCYTVYVHSITGRNTLNQTTYRIGLDLGPYSVGLSAIQIDDNGYPTRLLNTQSVIHDAGVDPNQRKNGSSRRKEAGVARRVRRMRRYRRQRLNKLDNLLTRNGYPIIDPYSLHGFKVWLIRAKAAEQYIEDDNTRKAAISIACEHIARHRGWRNPYQNPRTLLNAEPDSPTYGKLRESAANMMGGTLPDDRETPAQIVADVLAYHAGESAIRLRKSTAKTKKNRDALLPVKLMQADNAYELRRILDTQKVDKNLAEKLILTVFHQKSPKGSAEHLAGKDPLDPTQARAPKSTLAFQRYRIADTVSNLRVDHGRRLTVDEKQRIVDMLSNDTGKTPKYDTWDDIAKTLGHPRSWLKGVASTTPGGMERVTGRPPHIDILRKVNAIKEDGGKGKNTPSLRNIILRWWKDAGDADREALIRLLSNTIDLDMVYEDPEYANATLLLDSLDDMQLSKLDGMNLESGRAAYSENTLNKLTDWMLTHEGDITDAREQVFHVARDWRPPQDPVATPVGHPTVDRTIKIASRWLNAIIGRYGRPQSVQIEHVRDAFSSVETRYKEAFQWQVSNRYKSRNATRKHLQEADGLTHPHPDDIRRQEAITRQSGACLYCGRPITFNTCEMDHIVPRRGAGCTNTADNLVAVCPECNRLKGDTLFSVFCQTDAAKERGIDLRAAVKRVKAFNLNEQGYGKISASRFKKGVIGRLTQTEADEPIDNRSLASTAWMATELHNRLDYAFNNPAGEYYKDDTPVTVNVYRGELTAEARNIMRHAAGMDFHMIGGHGKTRLDRRHHAIDASVIAMMTPAAAQAIAERLNLRDADRINHDHPEWKEWPISPSANYGHWLTCMSRLLGLLNTALDDDRIHVLRNQRYRLGNSAAHKDTIIPLAYRKLGDPLDALTIRHATTPALYTALTHLPDFDEENGLPADPGRHINVNGQTLTAGDTITFFTGDAAQILTNHGGVAVGSMIHHARVYRYYTMLKSGKRKYAYGWVRVYQQDLLHAHGDLFAEPLKPSSLSLRYADPKLRAAIDGNRAEYLGYLLVGDELDVNFTEDDKGSIGTYMRFFAGDAQRQPQAMSKWVITGFPENGRISLKPAYLAGEGLDKLEQETGEPIPSEVKQVVAGEHGYCPSVNTLFARHPYVIRRNTLGEPRRNPANHMPALWRIGE